MRLRGLAGPGAKGRTRRGDGPGRKQLAGGAGTLRDSCGKETRQLPVSELTLVQRLSSPLKLHVIGITEALISETVPPQNENHLGVLVHGEAQGPHQQHDLKGTNWRPIFNPSIANGAPSPP